MEHAAAFEQIAEMLASSRGVILATHENPDEDGLGAMLALWHHLRRGSVPVLPYTWPLPQRVRGFLPGAWALQDEFDSSFGDTIVALDYGDFPRTRLQGLIAQRPFRVITLDHHEIGEHIGDPQLVDPDVSATCELVYYYLRHVRAEISREMATCLLAGIFHDTGGFRHSNTTQAVFEVAADLVRRGALLSRVARYFLPSRSAGILKLWARALERLEYDREVSMGYAVIFRSDLEACPVSDGDLDGLRFMLNTMAGSRFTALLREREPGHFRVSLRSEAFRGADVSAIARCLGGGGHRYASGCSIQGDLSEALLQLRDAARSAASYPAGELPDGTVPKW